MNADKYLCICCFAKSHIINHDVNSECLINQYDMAIYSGYLMVSPHFLPFPHTKAVLFSSQPFLLVGPNQLNQPLATMGHELDSLTEVRFRLVRERTCLGDFVKILSLFLDPESKTLRLEAAENHVKWKTEQRATKMTAFEVLY